MTRARWRCLVIDDERPARERVKRLLAPADDFEVVGEAGDADAAVELIDGAEPDLVFLDVQMPEGDGFDVLRRVRRIPRVIFTTAYDRYAVRAFEVGSLDYLLKPFTRARFGEALERARLALGEGGDPATAIRDLLARLDAERAEPAERTEHAERVEAPERIAGRRGARIVLLDPGDVLWFEAEDTLVFARTAEGRFLVERTLSDLEDDLGGRYFRAHRRYLVNLARVEEIRPAEAGTYRIAVAGAPDDEVPLSRRQARRLREVIPW